MMDASNLPADTQALDRVRSNLVYSNAQPVQQVLADLGELAALDKEFEAKERFWKWVSGIGVALAVLSGIATFFTEQFAILTGVGLGVLMAIVGMSMVAIRGRLNLDDRRYQLIEAMLGLLRHDIDTAAPLDISIDFNAYHQNKYLQNTEGSGFFSTATARQYELPWFAMKGALADGSRFRLAITQMVKRKEQAKRKYTKVKEAFREKISLTIQVKPRRCPDLANWPALVQQAPLPPGLNFSRAEANANRMTLVVASDRRLRSKGRYGTTGEQADQETCDHHGALSLFFACYSALDQCRRQPGAG